MVHVVNGVGLRFQSHIEEDNVAGLQFLAKPIEEPVMGGQLPSVFVLYAKKQVHKKFFIK
jgi:hypothetical protein